MSKSNLYKIIIVVVIIIIIIVALLLLLLNRNEYENETYVPAPSVTYSEEVEKLEDYNKFYSLEEMIKKYCIYDSYGNSEGIYSVLDNAYCEANGITAENTVNKIERHNLSDYNLILEEAYIYDDSLYPIFFTKSIIRNTEEKQELYLILKMDQANLTFSVIPINKEVFDGYINNQGSKLATSPIEKNNYNTQEDVTVSEKNVLDKYFDNYIYELMYRPEEAYSRLNEEYRTAKFTDYNDFLNYINVHNSEIVQMDIKSAKTLEDFATEDDYNEYMVNYELKGINLYKIEEKEEYKQYICIDNFGNYYIFRENGVNDYDILLDTYTIDLPEFLEKYNNSNRKDKVLYNVQKIVDALNTKDYRYVYNKMDETFRNNNYKTLEEFEQYIQNSIFEKNTVGYTNYAESGDISTVDLKLQDKTEREDGIYTMTVAMQLKEGTDFVMSFTMK